jgi:hypothetical protein
MRETLDRSRKIQQWFRAVAILSWAMFAGTAWGQSPVPSPRENRTVVLLDFSPAVDSEFWERLRAELKSTNVPEPLGKSTLWMRRQDFQRGMEFSEVLQVQLTGECATGLDQGRNATPGPLGWVYLVDGQIQPFAFVDCNRIALTLRGELQGRTWKERHKKMSRAIARVVAHELTHIVTQNPDHANEGIQKARLTQMELAGEAFY